MHSGLGKIATVLLFGLVAAGFFLGKNPLVKRGTGDEPHYLIIADSIAHFGGPELSDAYSTGSLAKTLLPSDEIDYSAEALKAVRGPFPSFHALSAGRGLFSVHNLGLPLLLVPIVKLGGGITAAKWVLILLSLSLPLLGWRAAESFIAPFGRRLLAAMSLSVVTLFAVAASQIYPDLLAGVALSWGSLGIARRRLDEGNRKSTASEIPLALALAFVPWLHVRLLAPMLLVLTARFLLLRQRPLEKLIWISAAALSLLALGWYNDHAFGNVTGPYSHAGTIEVSPTALMVLFGLQFDQFQGIFVHAPIYLCALLGLGALARRDGRLTAFFVLLYGSLVVPNALHPNWYGGGSFGGRFVLAGGIVLMAPAAYGLARLFAKRPALGVFLCGFHLTVQAFIWYRYAVTVVPVHTLSPERALEDYDSAWAPHQYWLPALFRIDIAVRHWPNFAWGAALVLLILAGWLWRGRGERLLYLAALSIVAGGVAGAVERPTWRITAPIAPADTGHLTQQEE